MEKDNEKNIYTHPHAPREKEAGKEGGRERECIIIFIIIIIIMTLPVAVVCDQPLSIN